MGESFGGGELDQFGGGLPVVRQAGRLRRWLGPLLRLEQITDLGPALACSCPLGGTRRRRGGKSLSMFFYGMFRGSFRLRVGGSFRLRVGRTILILPPGYFLSYPSLLGSTPGNAQTEGAGDLHAIGVEALQALDVAGLLQLLQQGADGANIAEPSVGQQGLAAGPAFHVSVGVGGQERIERLGRMPDGPVEQQGARDNPEGAAAHCAWFRGWRTTAKRAGREQRHLPGWNRGRNATFILQ